MDCPCPRCNQKDEMSRFFGGYKTQPPAELPQEVLSVYDSLEQIAIDLNSTKNEHIIERIDDIQKTLGEIDQTLRELQVECIKRPIDLTQYKLGEISRKLF